MPSGSQYSKTCVKRPLSKRPKFGFQDQLSLNVGQKYCRMLQSEHSAILSSFIKQPFVIRSLFFLGFQDQLSLNAGQKYCRMLQREHSAICSTFIKLPFVINIFVLSWFSRPIIALSRSKVFKHSAILFTFIKLYHLSLRSLFSGRFTQVLYFIFWDV